MSNVPSFDSLSVQNGRDDRVGRKRIVILGSDDHHRALRVTDQDELGIRTAGQGVGNVAEQVSSSLPGSAHKVGDS